MATTATSTRATPGKVVVGALSEALIPGGSHLVQGDLSQGAVHLLLGVAAAVTLGPLGLIGVKALSLAKSSTGQSPLDKIME
jgi:hypothetical protein